MDIEKKDITPPQPENTPDYDVENFPKAMRDIIAKQGEVPFLKKVSRLIKKHTKINVDLTSGQVTVTVAGIIVIDENFRKK